MSRKTIIFVSTQVKDILKKGSAPDPFFLKYVLYIFALFTHSWDILHRANYPLMPRPLMFVLW